MLSRYGEERTSGEYERDRRDGEGRWRDPVEAVERDLGLSLELIDRRSFSV